MPVQDRTLYSDNHNWKQIRRRNYLLEHLRPHFQREFGLELTSRYRRAENTMDLYRYCKNVAVTLHSWGLPIGSKKLENLTPRVSVVSGAFIRGVFDTDGSVYRKYGPYAQVQFKTVCKPLMSFIGDKLTILGLHHTRIRPDETKQRFYLCRQEKVDSFFRIVKPSNPKHIDRFNRIRR